jgi:hypothetical protein
MATTDGAVVGEAVMVNLLEDAPEKIVIAPRDYGLRKPLRKVFTVS